MKKLFKNFIKLTISIILIFMTLIYFHVSLLYAQDLMFDTMITKIIGKVEYKKGEQFLEALVFMKIRNNDYLKIHENSEVSILFQSNGHQEIWKGPVSIQIGEYGSTVENGTNNKILPKIKKLPINTSDKVFSGSNFTAKAINSRAGVTIVRNASTQQKVEEKIKEGLKTYGNLKKELGEKDIIPELYLLELYSENGEYEKTKEQLKNIYAKFPDNNEFHKCTEEITTNE
ncbi:MAG: hypothetical protein HQK76_16030 [Desulfobacterales bacterium]|nr:hypothetical protein [Desulfobacterales bacterium]